MKEYELIELGECPICHGTGVLEEENGWWARSSTPASASNPLQINL